MAGRSPRLARMLSGLLLAAATACQPAAPPARGGAEAASPPRDVSGRLLYSDGSPVARTPYEIHVAGRFHVATTDATGGMSAPAMLPASARAVSLRLLDGFALGLAPDDAIRRTLRVPCSESGRMRDTYLLETAPAMVLVTVPESATGPIARAVTALDLIGIHGPRELMTILSASRIAALRDHGLEVLVLDVDANSYAARTSDMTDSERSNYIDMRMHDARSNLRRLRDPRGRDSVLTK